jgi:hypothetical protein
MKPQRQLSLFLLLTNLLILLSSAIGHPINVDAGVKNADVDSVQNERYLMTNCYSLPGSLKCNTNGGSRFAAIDFNDIEGFCDLSGYGMNMIEAFSTLEPRDQCDYWYIFLKTGGATYNYDDYMKKQSMSSPATHNVVENNGVVQSGTVDYGENLGNNRDDQVITGDGSALSRRILRWVNIKVNGAKWRRNASNATTRAALNSFIGAVGAFCGKVFLNDDRSICDSTSNGVICASWSGGGNNFQASSLVAMLEFLYDQGDMWEVGDSSFVIDKGLNQIQFSFNSKRDDGAVFKRDQCVYDYTTVGADNFCLSNRPNGCT